jgi:two-component system, NarL family, nitrate/nitrite response regulator NarL
VTHARPLYQAAQQTTVHTTVVIAAYSLVREALEKLLEGDPQVAVIGGAVDARDAVTLAATLRPAVLLLDDAMPDASAATTLRELARAAPGVRTLLVTADDDPAYALEALSHGARGIVLKRSPSHLLAKSIREVAEGHYWVGRQCLDGLLDRIRERGAWPAAAPSPPHGLSARELEVVAAIVAGCTNDEIARTLQISVKTVKRHLTSIFSKVGTSNRLELASFAIGNRLGADSTAVALPSDRT